MDPARAGGNMDDSKSAPRALSFAQLPIWHAEVLHRGTPRWVQVTIVSMRGSLDIDRLESAIAAAVAHYPALRTMVQLQNRQPLQVFAVDAAFQLQRHDLSTRPDPERQARAFIEAASREAFPLYHSPLFRGDLLVLAPEAFMLVLRLHHVAADGIALALILPWIAMHYRREGRVPEFDEPDQVYERWLDRYSGQAETAGLDATLAFYSEALAGAPTHHASLYDRAAGDAAHEPPDLPEATHTLEAAVGDALRSLARASGATLFIVLFAAYAAVLREVVGSSDLVISTFVSGRAGEARPLVGMCINTVLVRLRLGGRSTGPELITAVQEGWRPVREHQVVPMFLLSRAKAAPPKAQFAINYLDMAQASFEVPGITAAVTHAQQGFPLNDLLFYIIREQDGQLRMRLIAGSGTPGLSKERLASMLDRISCVLQSWLGNNAADPVC